jgi:hypothetical protein
MADMTTRRSHPTSYWEQSLTDDQWTLIEGAGQIVVSLEQRDEFQSAYERFQLHRALLAASPPARDVKEILSRVHASLEDCRAVLSDLLDKDPANKAALHGLREALALGGSPPPGPSEIRALCVLLERYASRAMNAAERQPRGSPGAISKHWRDDLLEAAQSIFEDAGGRKKRLSAYMNAVKDAVGYRPPSPETFKRKVDKRRRHKRVQ